MQAHILYFRWLEILGLVANVQLKTPGGGVLPYKGLMGTCGQPGYVFRDFCLKQGTEFIILQAQVLINIRVKCLKQGIKNLNSVLTLYSLRVTYRFYLSNARRFYSSKGDPLGLKGLKKLSPLTLYSLRVTYRFYSV